MTLRRTISSLGLVPVGKRSVTPVPKRLLAMVPKPTDSNITVKPSNADPIKDTMPLIKQKISRTNWQVRQLAQELKGASIAETLRNNYDFLFNHIQYVPDKKGEEQVRSPRRLIHEGKGDCDCYTVTLGALLTQQNIPFKIRVSANQNPSDWGHVYIVVPKDGDISKPLVKSQDYYTLDPVVHQFNSEAPKYKSKDFTMKLVSMDGLGDIHPGFAVQSLGDCTRRSSASMSRIDPTKDNAALIPKLRRFVNTKAVLESGLIPTKAFLSSKNIPHKELMNSDGSTSYAVQAGASEINVPSILTPGQASAIESSQLQQATLPAITKKQEASGWLVAILLSGGLLWSASY